MSGLKTVSKRRGDALSRTGWDQLETLLATYYRGEGYEVDHVGTGATGAKFDGGVDLKLRRDDEYIVVQCKHWNTLKVPHNEVHQLLGIMVNQGATGAILVTSGEFTKAAIEAATRKGHVQLIDGDELRAMLGPLPEPEASAPSSMIEASNDGRGVVGSVGRDASERLLEAAEFGLRGGFQRSSRAPRMTASAVLSLAVLKFVLAALGVLVIWLVMQGIFSRLQNSLQATAQRASPAPLSVPAAQVPVHVARRERIEAPNSPAAIENTTRREPTAAEMREARRKADEAIKVLEATTPEM